jgi:hypothetical protein
MDFTHSKLDRAKLNLTGVNGSGFKTGSSIILFKF